jgi:hypothetical protein
MTIANNATEKVFSMISFSLGYRGSIERKDAFPVVLHADDGPVVFLCLVVKCLGKGADPRIGKPLRRTVGIFALSIVVQHKHHQSRAVTRACVFQHLSVAGRVAKCRARAAADLQMDTLRFTGIVIVQEKLGFFGEKRLTVLIVAELRPG